MGIAVAGIAGAGIVVSGIAVTIAVGRTGAGRAGGPAVTPAPLSSPPATGTGAGVGRPTRFPASPLRRTGGPLSAAAYTAAYALAYALAGMGLRCG